MEFGKMYLNNYVVLQYWDLKDTFNKLKSLTTLRTLSARICFMIMDVMDLWKNKWLPKRLDNVPMDINQIKDVYSASDNCSRSKYFERYL